MTVPDVLVEQAIGRIFTPSARRVIETLTAAARPLTRSELREATGYTSGAIHQAVVRLCAAGILEVDKATFWDDPRPQYVLIRPLMAKKLGLPPAVRRYTPTQTRIEHGLTTWRIVAYGKPMSRQDLEARAAERIGATEARAAIEDLEQRGIIAEDDGLVVTDGPVARAARMLLPERLRSMPFPWYVPFTPNEEEEIEAARQREAQRRADLAEAEGLTARYTAWRDDVVLTHST